MIKKPAELSLTDSILAAMRPGTIMSYETLCQRIGRKNGVPRALEALAEKFIVQALPNDEYVRLSDEAAAAQLQVFERMTAKLRGITRANQPAKE